MIIAQLFGPLEVTPYNIAYRYFGVMSMIFGIITTPFWSAYTEAYYKKDIAWVKNATRRLIIMWALMSFGTAVMLFFSGFVYRIWIGELVTVPFGLSAIMALFVIIGNWNNIFAYFLNGTGKIRLQLYSAIFVGLINIPLSILFAKYLHLDIVGVVLATCVCMLVGSVWAPIQYYKIINNTAKGIWAK
jgi:Na+-driven multidrug efflux pump